MILVENGTKNAYKMWHGGCLHDNIFKNAFWIMHVRRIWILPYIVSLLCKHRCLGVSWIGVVIQVCHVIIAHTYGVRTVHVYVRIILMTQHPLSLWSWNHPRNRAHHSRPASESLSLSADLRPIEGRCRRSGHHADHCFGSGEAAEQEASGSMVPRCTSYGVPVLSSWSR